MVWGAVAGAAANFALSKLGGDGGARKDRQWNHDNTMFERDWRRKVFKTSIQTAAADAKKAGLHPLFALGGSMNNSGSYSVGGMVQPGQSQSGSAAGDAVRGLGEAYDNWQREKENTRRDERDAKANAEMQGYQKRLMSAQTRQAEARALLAESEAARVTQSANSTRPSYIDPETGVQVIPAGEEKRLPGFKELPTKVHPRQQLPSTVEGVEKHGKDRYRYANPDLEIELVNDIIWGINRLEQLFRPSTDALTDRAARAFPHRRGYYRKGRTR